MILKSFCDGDLSVKLELSIDFDEEEIRLEVMRGDMTSGTGDGISFDASEFGAALEYFSACVNGDVDAISSFDATCDRILLSLPSEEDHDTNE
jgi:hypothetical protein